MPAAPRPPTEEGATSSRFAKSDRVRRRGEYKRIQGASVRVAGTFVVWLVRARDDGARRLGITVTKKIATAVGRNRIKRVVRETFRQHRELFPDASDIVAVARSAAVEMTTATFLAEVASLSPALRRAASRAASAPVAR